jgi:ATP-dependent DNA helicase RecQ
MNYLQVPSGSGEGIYYDFDMNDFIKKFGHDSQQVLYSLKALEQEQILNFNDQVFLSSRVQFITDKETLYEFENTHPDLEPIVKALLRTYEGIFDQPVFIHEKSIAFLLRKDLPSVIEGLRRLHMMGIIDYAAQKDSPQIYFIQNRVHTSELNINKENYNKRKQQLINRITEFIKYITNTRNCRSQIIGSYFGDDTIKNCKICDNCLNHHNNEISNEEFENIHHKILTLLEPKPFQSRELLQHLPGIKKEKAWKVVHFLQAENKIELDKDGMIRLK